MSKPSNETNSKGTDFYWETHVDLLMAIFSKIGWHKPPAADVAIAQQVVMGSIPKEHNKMLG